MRSRYFQEELEYLRHSGEEFSQFYPKMAKYLSERSHDPDVERLLEGFAFLTSRLREKIDDQLPEVTETLLTLLWPNFLRPIPSMAMMQLNPVPGSINEEQIVKKGTVIESIPVSGTVCQFRTAYDTTIHPLKIARVRHESSREASIVAIHLHTLNDEPIDAIKLKTLRLYFGGSKYSALNINLWIHCHLSKCMLRNVKTGDRLPISTENIKQVGLDEREDVLPYPKNSFIGYRLLQEYFAFPEKYYFVDIENLPVDSFLGSENEFEIVFDFHRPLPADVRVNDEAFKLHCVPAINLFEHDAEPILLEGKRDEYKILPARRDGGELDIFSVETVEGWKSDPEAKSGGINRTYHRFESFMHELERAEARTAVYYREKVRQSISGQKLDRFLSFLREDELSSVGRGETISTTLICSNGRTPTALNIGDICIPTSSTPSFVKPNNITRPSDPLYPIVDGTLQWQLISSLSLNYLSLQNIQSLRTILSNFDFGAKVDRQKEREAKRRLLGIDSIETDTIDHIYKGLPIRGIKTVLRMKESHYESDGELYLFATILANFFALYATINSFHELVVKGIETGEEYRWTPSIGRQPLI